LLALREAQLKELQHRLKNNLQLVASLLSMQARRATTEDLRRELQRALTRVRAVGHLHAQLRWGADEVTEVPLQQYLRDLGKDLAEVFCPEGKSFSLEVEAEPWAVAADRAGPLGLIVNELVTNAFSHAFGERARGKVHVHLAREGSRLRLAVSDDDVGFDWEERASGAGLQLVQLLVNQIGGTIAYERRDGSRISVLL
jgi:two-component sensor histidine kinase